MAETDDITNLSVVLDETAAFMDNLNVIHMSKPKAFENTYEFPVEVTNLKSDQLGSLNLKIGAFLSYTLEVLGKQSADLSLLEGVYGIKLGLEIATEKKKHSGNTAREILESVVLADNDSLRKMHNVILRRRHKIATLQARVDSYREQLTRLSREQSRREAETSRFN